MNNVLLMGFVGFLGYLIKEIPRTIFDLCIKNIIFSFSITTKEKEIYDNISQWLSGLSRKAIDNNLNCKNFYKKGAMHVVYTLNYGNYLVRVGSTFLYITKDMIKNNNDIHDIINIRIFGFNKNKYKSDIKDIVDKSAISDNKLILFPKIYNNEKLIINKRSFDNIFNNEKYKIINHLDNWINNKDFYDKHDLVYKTGLLLYGDPGTGKSSIIRAIASKLNFNIHLINLKSSDGSSSLLYKICEIEEESLIVFEDIDCIFNTSRDENSDNEILGIILNFIDGTLSPNNCVFVATTNHIDRLDKALIRKGRFDLSLEIKDIDIEIAKEMCDNYNCDYSILDDENFPINPSYLQSKILENIN